ncbi:hypothetical protein [Pedobacter sp. MC2016-24]|uniref:hypothetical protein n=1 Tax=Pedobacter sp. MC2016-24 TaxID=2780090 RepID=UPI0018827E55|nr:hypothetical protein [Pedobacter sp. MC2016-24]MBE9599878.1 hypothetical protein [Pedobacter sp. MC2016-24]
MTSIVEYVLSKADEDPDAPFSNHDLVNNLYFEDAQGNIYSRDQRDEQIEKWRQEHDAFVELLEEDEQNASYLEQSEKLEEQIDDLRYASEQYAEVYEWWICSSWLSRRLQEYDQIIIIDGNNAYWGRCTTGQAILLDLVISRICADMEILEGQVNMWK